MHSLATCRFCKKPQYRDSGRPFMKYGPRHYACQPCYLDHKDLDKLTDWQIGQFSFSLLKERNRLDYFERRLNPRD